MPRSTSGAAIAALPARDTVKQAVADGRRRLIARDASARGDLPGPDAAGVPPRHSRVSGCARALRRAGDRRSGAGRARRAAVRVVEGDAGNIKITTASDLEMSRALPANRLRQAVMRAGTGYDLHRLVEGRPLLLGGVTIPSRPGALGHSDADVVCHAVTDAILGAAGAGDIGRHFPDTDPRWKDASSIHLLRRPCGSVREARLRRRQRRRDRDPRAAEDCAARRPRSQRRLAAALGIDAARVSVKGKTNEGVDAVGRGEAIAAHAVALLSVERSRVPDARRVPKPDDMRVRFAPSPTGQLHVGNARTALFNWLLAHGKDGTLRPPHRGHRHRAVDARVGGEHPRGLRWLGLDWDEGPDVGGLHGPYRQSERLHLYASYANELIAGGHAYYCFCSPAKLEADRKATWPPAVRRSIAAPAAICRRTRRAAASTRASARSSASRCPRHARSAFQDLVRGEVVVQHAT